MSYKVKLSLDLMGKKFGSLTVIKYLGRSYWECKCECNDEKTVKRKANDLISGRSKHCGCLKSKPSEDLTGRKFGEYKVLEYIKNGKYKCECSCGNIKEVSGSKLVNNIIKSCGHLKKDVYYDMVDKHYSELYVIEYLGNGIVKCRCSCGNIKDIEASNVKNGSTKSCGCLASKKSLIRIGKQYGNWKVLEYLGDRKYKCECTCGLVKEIYLSTLESENDICRHLEKYIGTRSGKLFVKGINRIGELNKLICDCDCGKKDIDVFSSNIISGLSTSCGCSNNISSYEDELYNLFPCSVRNKMILDTSTNKKQQIDLLYEDEKVGIEFNGDYWHSSLKRDKNYHWNKTKIALDNNIELIHIFEHEWINNKEKLISYIKGRLNKNKVLGARKCILEEISSKETMEFENKYHLNGFSQSSIRIGLRYKSELVALMTFGKSRFDKNYEYELIRLTMGNYNIIGGSNKLFKYFIENYKPKSIVSYCDRSKFTGKVYERLGFKYLSHTQPNYKWVKHTSKIEIDVLNRMKTQKHKLIERGLGNEEMTEEEIMKSLKYLKIYDCGNDKYEWLNNEM